MQHSHRRFLSAAILLSVLAAVSSSCGSETQTAPETGAVTAETTETLSADTTEPEEIHFSDSLTAEDFGGAAFRIYTTNDINGMQYTTLQNYAETETGEVVNDTLFARDIWLEETYNVDMVYTIETNSDTGSMNKKLTKTILAGDDVYDMIMHDVAEIAKTQTTSGNAYPLNQVTGIDLNAEYWFPELNNELKFGDNLFIAANVISPRFYGSAYIILFNRSLATELDLPDMYTLVNEGKWTFDAMIENAKLAAADLNGDGTMDEADRYGFGWEVLTPEAYVLGADMHYVQNVNGKMTSMLDDEKLVTFMQKIQDNIHESYAIQDGGKLDTTTIISDGRFLYWNPCTFNLLEYRDVSYDYGILPMPKYDENQAEYVTYAQPWVVSSPVIPITVGKDALSRVGTIVNAMAAYGYDYLRPAVFENVIQLKGARDEQSAQIIDKMFENVTFELTSIYSIGNFGNTFHAFFTSGKKNDVTSAYEKLRSAVEKDLVSISENYDEIAASLLN